MTRWVKCTTVVDKRDIHLNAERIFSLTRAGRFTWVGYGGKRVDVSILESVEHILALLGDEVLDAQRAQREDQPAEVVGASGG